MSLTNKPIYLFLLLIFFSANVLGQDTFLSSEDELIAKASALFEAKNFEEAEPLYSQLLSLYPKDPEYNYKYGTSLLIAGNDREKALEYIQYGISKGNLENEAYFYLGKGYHMNYDFEKAIHAYKRYKERASNAKEEEYKVDHHIQMCENGKNLLKKFKGVKVLQKQDMTFENFYRIYELTGLKGQLLAKPEKFMSKHDKKVNESSVMFFPENAKELYYSSYGDKGENGKDIYKVILMGNGKWSDPINLGNVINTPFDEDFAFVHPETQVIYFASTGHNSMGGYDLFKSTYDPEIASWTKVENLDFPYSTVDNDYMYVETPGNPTAFFASDRFKTSGRTTVYKVNTIDVDPELAIIKGRLNVEGIPEIQKATITVKDEEGRLISKVETKVNTDYEIAFHENGGTYVFNVETMEDSPIHSGKIELPENEGLNVYSQELVIRGSLENQTLVIKNDFESSNTITEDLALSPEILKKQSDLSVNASEENFVDINRDENGAGTTGIDQVSGSVSGKNPASTAMSKEKINTEFSQLKDENSGLLQESLKLQNIAYSKAESYKNTADELYLRAEQENNEQSAISIRNEADQNAASAVSMIEIASELQEEIEALERLKGEINNADGEIAQLLLANNVVQAEKRLNILKNSLDNEAHANAISKNIANSADQLSSANKEIANVQSKENKIARDKKDIEDQIQKLEQEKAGANKKRREEIDASMRNFALDIEDLDFRLKKLQEEKKKYQLLASKSSVKKNSWDEILQTNSGIAAQGEFSKTDKTAIEAGVLALKESRKPFENIPGEKIDVYEGNAADQFVSNDSETDNEGNLTAQRSVATAEAENENETDFNTNVNINQPAENESDQANSSETKVITANQVQSQDVESSNAYGNAQISSSLSEEEADIYTLPASKEFMIEANNLQNQSEQKYKEYNDLLTSIRNLPTEEERTKAFEEAHKIQEEARSLQLQAAIVEGRANRIQYLRNNAHLRSMGDSPIPSASTNMILLLSDEAAIYYDQASKLREELDTSDRFTRKESIYQDALVYEKRALEKQKQALKMMNQQEDQITEEENIEERRAQAGESAEALHLEYVTLTRNADDLRKEADEAQNEKSKDSLLALAGEKDSLAGKTLIQANVLYTLSKGYDINQGLEDHSKPVLINVISEPEVVDSVEIAAISESEKQAIKNTAGFSEYQELYKDREDMVQSTFEVFQRAGIAEVKRDSLEQREIELRSAALEAGSEEEKIRMIREAVVINSQIAAINSSLDSASKIIKLRNFLIQRKEQALEQKLAEIGNGEKAEQIVLMAQVVYAENKNKESFPDDLAAEDNVGDPNNAEIEEITAQDELAVVKDEEVSDAEDIPVDELEEIEPDEPDEFTSEEVSSDESEVTEFKGTADVDIGDTESIASKEDPISEPLEPMERGEVQSNEPGFIPKEVKKDVFEIYERNSPNYSNNNPIPIDPVMPDGIVYQVQVGAFRNPIPQDHFQGFAPLMGVTAANGITRYTAGIFNEFSHADRAKDDIRALGYSDAFVVAFLNGKRISVSEARNREDSQVPSSSSGVFTTEETTATPKRPEVAESIRGNTEFANATNSNTINGTYFSIQIGVFSKPLDKDALGYDGLLIVDHLESGLYRYHIGIFDDLETAKQAQKGNISKEIPDSFVVAYHNGERISISQAIAIISNQ